MYVCHHYLHNIDHARQSFSFLIRVDFLRVYVHKYRNITISKTVVSQFVGNPSKKKKPKPIYNYTLVVSLIWSYMLLILYEYIVDSNMNLHKYI